nr:HNH endonuclease [Desulfobulbaceae bacterium]
MDDFWFDGIDEISIRRERDAARQLRKISWWQAKLSLGQCYYCSCKKSPKELTMDHITPLTRGGHSTKGNVVAACKECNTKKRSMLPLEWNEYMDSLEK